jgi:glutaredoxin/glutathione-dependent peroxiredoxin
MVSAAWAKLHDKISTTSVRQAGRGKAMTIKVGDKVPAVKLKQMTPEGMKDVDTGEFFKGKKVVLFALPGAFTPTCSAKHLPGFVEKAAELRAKGVDAIACLSVNDAFVMNAWGKDQKAEGKVQMLADGNGDFTRAIGLEMDGSGYGLGKRSQRYAMIVQDGVVKMLNVEKPGTFEVSSADAVLKAL